MGIFLLSLTRARNREGGENYYYSEWGGGVGETRRLHGTRKISNRFIRFFFLFPTINAPESPGDASYKYYVATITYSPASISVAGRFFFFF